MTGFAHFFLMLSLLNFICMSCIVGAGGGRGDRQDTVGRAGVRV